jgi:hypothetical protein
MGAGGDRELTKRHLAMIDRALTQRKRWYFRSVILAVISVLAFSRGGGVSIAFGVLLAALAVLALVLAEQVKRDAEALRARLEGPGVAGSAGGREGS